jgi:hypothetical protein
VILNSSEQKVQILTGLKRLIEDVQENSCRSDDYFPAGALFVQWFFVLKKMECLDDEQKVKRCNQSTGGRKQTLRYEINSTGAFGGVICLINNLSVLANGRIDSFPVKRRRFLGSPRARNRRSSSRRMNFSGAKNSPSDPEYFTSRTGLKLGGVPEIARRIPIRPVDIFLILYIILCVAI